MDHFSIVIIVSRSNLHFIFNDSYCLFVCFVFMLLFGGGVLQSFMCTAELNLFEEFSDNQFPLRLLLFQRSPFVIWLGLITLYIVGNAYSVNLFTFSYVLCAAMTKLFQLLSFFFIAFCKLSVKMFCFYFCFLLLDLVLCFFYGIPTICLIKIWNSFISSIIKTYQVSDCFVGRKQIDNYLARFKITAQSTTPCLFIKYKLHIF